MRQIEAIKADMLAANQSLRDMFPDGNVDGIPEGKRGEFDELNTKVRALDTEFEEASAALEAEAKERAEDAKRAERARELLSRGGTASDRIAASDLRKAEQRADVPEFLRALDVDEEYASKELREFYAGSEEAEFKGRSTEHGRAFNEYLRTGSAEALGFMKAHERQQNVGTAADGGYLVPEDNRFMNQVVVSMKAYMGVERVATVFTTPHGRPIPMPRIDDTAHDAVNATEGTAPSPADAPDLAFSELNLGAKKLGTGRLLVSTELIEDSGPMIESLIGRLLGKRIGRRIGQQLANGTGAGTPLQLRGILTQAAEAAAPNRLVYSKANGGTITNAATALTRIVRAIDIAYRSSARASIVFSDDLLNQLRVAVSTAGGFLYPMLSNIGPDNVRRWDGMRVLIDPNYPAFDQTVNNNVMGCTVGDHGEFYVRKVRGMRLVRNPFAEDDKDQVKFNMWHRCDSGLADLKAVRRVRVTTAA